MAKSHGLGMNWLCVKILKEHVKCSGNRSKLRLQMNGPRMRLATVVPLWILIHCSKIATPEQVFDGVKRYQTHVHIHTYIHALHLHYITLHLHYIYITFTLHYITLHLHLHLHYITLHYTTLHYTTLHYIHTCITYIQIYIYTHTHIYIFIFIHIHIYI